MAAAHAGIGRGFWVVALCSLAQIPILAAIWAFEGSTTHLTSPLPMLVGDMATLIVAYLYVGGWTGVMSRQSFRTACVVQALAMIEEIIGGWSGGWELLSTISMFAIIFLAFIIPCLCDDGDRYPSQAQATRSFHLDTLARTLSLRSGHGRRFLALRRLCCWAHPPCFLCFFASWHGIYECLQPRCFLASSQVSCTASPISALCSRL